MKKMRNYAFALLAIMFVFAGCHKKSSDVDSRDAFVGTYSYVTDGEMEFSSFVPGLNPVLPLKSEGIIKIEKLSKQDSVLISGAFGNRVDPFKAVVKGNQLEFVEDSYVAKGQTFEALMTISNNTATLAKDTLTWVDDHVVCDGDMMSVEISGEGHVTMKAAKKSAY